METIGIIVHPIQNMLIDAIVFIACPELYVGLVRDYVGKYLCFGKSVGK